MNQQDSQQYLARKQFFEQMLTIYGRKPVLEALQDKTLPAYRLHLADSNRKDGIIRDIQALAEQRDIETLFHSRDALARISRNGRQDQGVRWTSPCPAIAMSPPCASRCLQAFGYWLWTGLPIHRTWG